jgi:hypothetical protein
MSDHSPVYRMRTTHNYTDISQLPVLCYGCYISYKYVLRYLFKYNYWLFLSTKVSVV